MLIVTSRAQAHRIIANDLRAEALNALTQGERPGYVRNSEIGTELLVVGARAGVARNANAEWGDVQHDDEHGQVVVMDDTGERFNLSGVSLTEQDAAQEAHDREVAS